MLKFVDHVQFQEGLGVMCYSFI